MMNKEQKDRLVKELHSQIKAIKSRLDFVDAIVRELE